MKKIFIVFIVLSLISSSFSLSLNNKDNFNTKNTIRSVSTNSYSIFITTRNSIKGLSNNDSWTKKPEGRPWSIDSDNENVIVGLKLGGSKSLVLNTNGSLYRNFDEPFWVDRVKILQGKEKYFASSSKSFLHIYDKSGNKVFQEDSRSYTRNPSRKLTNYDKDNSFEIAFGGGLNSRTRAKIKDLSGDIHWKSSWKEGRTVVKSFKNRKLISWKNGISLRSLDGALLWSKNIDGFTRPIIIKDQIVYSDNGKLVFLNEYNSVEKSFGTGNLDNLIYLEDHNLVAGTGDGETVFVDLETDEVHSKSISGVEGLDKTDFDRDNRSELVVRKSRSVDVIDIEEDKKVSKRSVIYGSEPESTLKAISLNMTVFVGDETAVPDRFENFTQASKADFSDLTSERKSYYAGSREKAVYLAPIAARNNAVLIFDRDSADRDFSNYTVSELQELFIERFKPHHLAVADLKSEKGLLASYIAVRQSALPVQKRSSSELQIESIEKMFDSIGENRNTVFDGKYVSLLDAPEFEKEDPVEEGVFKDSEDGKTYKTDLEYGNLDSDKYLEAGVGRYPEDLEKSSLIFYRSMNRALGENATVASEYLSTNWPTILATGGGGLRYGSRMERVFKEENYDTTHLVEYRSEPVKFLTSLTPVEITSFLGEVDDIGDIVAEFVSDSAANAVENSLILFKALNYTEQLMEMYFEFDWAGHEFSLDRGIDRLQELDIDPESDGGVQKSVMKLLYAFVWPERHPNLNQSSLTDNMERSDILYYQGVGDENNWRLPENKSYSQSFDPEDIAELNRTIVWDNSDLGANGEMRKGFIEQGASSYIGYSSVNYPAYSSLTAYNFFRHRKTLGNSLKASINQMKTTDNIYSVSAVYKTGLKQKMLESLRLYGNPEMRKDPVNSERFKVNRSCDQSICKLDISIDTPQKIIQRKDSKTVSSNSSKYLLQPGAVITPVYSYTRELPESAEIIDRNENLTVSEHEDLEMERFTPISSGGKVLNISDRNHSISKTDLEFNDSSLTYTVAGVKNDSVVESAELEIRYRTPVNVKAETENRSLKARIHSDNSFDGKIMYQVGNITGTKSVSIEEGENIFELENLSYGQHQTEIVVVDEDIIATTREKVRIGKPLEIALFSPEIREASTREITALVSNPNSFKVKETVKIRTGNKTVPGMLEDTERSVTLRPEESNRLNWRILGTEKGNTTLKLEDETEKVQVRSSTDSEKSISADSIIRTLSSPTSEISATVSDGALDLEWSASRGVLTVKRNSTTSVSRLETDGFEAFKQESAERSEIRVVTGNGTYIRTSQNGLIERKRGLDEDIAQRKIRKLEREVKKVDKIFSQRLKAEY